MATEFIDLPSNTPPDVYRRIQHILRRWSAMKCTKELKKWSGAGDKHPSGVPKTITLTIEDCES